MKVFLTYYSETGNTEKAAQAKVIGISDVVEKSNRASLMSS